MGRQRMENRTLLVSYTDQGKKKMEEIRSLLEDSGRTVFGLERPRGGDFLGEYWRQVQEIIFVGAAGIAVRLCAPFIRDKFTDPAVLVLDEKGKFVIPLLSGHVGGANDLALFLAEATGAEAVITTATDVNGRFAVDVFAKKCGLVLTDRAKAKDISARILKGEKVGFYSEFPVLGGVPEELVQVESRQQLGLFPMSIAVEERKKGETGEQVLCLLPRNLTAGVGCKRGVPRRQLEAFLRQKLTELGFHPGQVKRLASIDRKAEEEGLKALAETWQIPFETWTADQLAAVGTVTSESAFVKETVGVGNVCERAAILGSGGGRLVLEKTAEQGMTLALAAEDWSVDFDKTVCDRPGAGQL